MANRNMKAMRNTERRATLTPFTLWPRIYIW